MWECSISSSALAKCTEFGMILWNSGNDLTKIVTSEPLHWQAFNKNSNEGFHRRQGAGWCDKHIIVHKHVYTWLEVHFNTYWSAEYNPNFLRWIYLKGIGAPRSRCLEWSFSHQLGEWSMQRVFPFSDIPSRHWLLIDIIKIWTILYYQHPPSSHALARDSILQYGRGNIAIELSRYLYSKVSSLHISTPEIIPEVKA